MSSMYLSQLRKNRRYQNASAEELGRMVYDQSEILQQVSFEDFMPIFNDTGEVTQLKQLAQPVAQVAPTPEEETDWGQVGLDSVDAVQSGFLNASAGLAEGVGGLYKWATGEESPTAGSIAGFLRDQGEKQINQMSESGKSQMQSFGVEYDSENGVNMAEGSTLVGGLLNVASGSGSVLPYMVPGGLGAKALSMGGRAIGGKVMPSLARKAALGVPAGRVPQALSMAAVGGTGIGGETKHQAYQQAYNTPTWELNRTPAYQAVYWKIADAYEAEGVKATNAQIEEASRLAVAEAASDDAFADGFSLGAVSMGALGPMFLNNVLGRVNGGFLKRAISGAAIEGTQELIESGGQTYIANEAVGEHADSSVQPMDNVIGDALTGGLTGAGVGGSMSLVGGIASKPFKSDSDMPDYFREQEKLRKAALRAEQEQSESDKVSAAAPVVEEEQDLVGDNEAPVEAAPTPVEEAVAPVEAAPVPTVEATPVEDSAVPVRPDESAPTTDEAPNIADELGPVDESAAKAPTEEVIVPEPVAVEENAQTAEYRADLQRALELNLSRSKNPKVNKVNRQAAKENAARIEAELGSLDGIGTSNPAFADPNVIAVMGDGTVVYKEGTAPEDAQRDQTPYEGTLPSFTDPLIEARLRKWAEFHPEKGSDTEAEQRVLKDALLREIKTLNRVESGTKAAFRIEDRIASMETHLEELSTPKKAKAVKIKKRGIPRSAFIGLKPTETSDIDTVLERIESIEQKHAGIPELMKAMKDARYLASIDNHNGLAMTAGLVDGFITNELDEAGLIQPDLSENQTYQEFQQRLQDAKDNLGEAELEVDPINDAELQSLERDAIRNTLNQLRVPTKDDGKPAMTQKAKKQAEKDAERFEAMSRVSDINELLKSTHRRLTNTLGKKSADIYVQHVGSKMGLFIDANPTPREMYDEYLANNADRPTVGFEEWTDTIYQKGKPPTVDAKKPSPQPVEEPVEVSESDIDPDNEPTPPMKAVPKSKVKTDAKGTTVVDGKSKGNKAELIVSEPDAITEEIGVVEENVEEVEAEVADVTPATTSVDAAPAVEEEVVTEEVIAEAVTAEEEVATEEVIAEAVTVEETEEQVAEQVAEEQDIVNVPKTTVKPRKATGTENESELMSTPSISNNEPTDVLRDDAELIFEARKEDQIKLALYSKKKGSGDADVPRTFSKMDDAEAMAKQLERVGLGLYRPIKYGERWALDTLIVARTVKSETPMVYDNQKSAENGKKRIKSSSAYDIQKSRINENRYIVTTLSEIDRVGTDEAIDGTSDFKQELNTQFRDNLSESIQNSGAGYVQVLDGGIHPQLFKFDAKDKGASFIAEGMAQDESVPIEDLINPESKNKSDVLTMAIDTAQERLRATDNLAKVKVQQGIISEEALGDKPAVSVMYAEVNKFESIDNEDGSLTILGSKKFVDRFLSGHKFNVDKEGEPLEIAEVTDDQGALVGLSVPKGHTEKPKQTLRSRGLYLVDSMNGPVEGAVHTVTPPVISSAISASQIETNDSQLDTDIAIGRMEASLQESGTPKTAAEKAKRKADKAALAAFKAKETTPLAANNNDAVNLDDEGLVPVEEESADLEQIEEAVSAEETVAAENTATAAMSDFDSAFDDVVEKPAPKSVSKLIDEEAPVQNDADASADQQEKDDAEARANAKKEQDDFDDFYNVGSDYIDEIMPHVSRHEANTPTGMSVESVQKVIDNFEAKYNGIPDIKYMVTDQYIDSDQAAADGGQVAGSYDAKNKLVTINRSVLKNSAHAEAVLRHEILAHFGLSVIPTLEGRMDILRKVSQAEGKNKQLTNFFTEIRGTYAPYIAEWKADGITDEGIEALVAEEVMARVAEEPDQSVFGKVWNDIVAYFMEALRKVGFYEHYTKSDIRRTLMGFGKKFSSLDVETSLQVNGLVRDVRFSVPAKPEGDMDSALALIEKNRKAAEVQATFQQSIEVKPSKIVKAPKQGDLELHQDRQEAVVVMPDLIPDRGRITDHSSSYSDSLDAGQRLGVDLGLTAMINKNRRGYLLADGTGFGKTRQLLAMADQYKKRTGEKVLILTENATTISKNFAYDAAAMGIDMSQFKTGTYAGFKDYKTGGIKAEFDQEWGMVLFDEAHNLKNYNTLQAKAARRLKKKKVVYATATPMDRPDAGAFMWADVVGKDYKTTLDLLGLKIVNETVFVKGKRVSQEVPALKQGMTTMQVVANVAVMRNSAIKNGAMIKRYYPFFGSTNKISVAMTEEAQRDQTAIDKYWQKEISRVSQFSNPKNIRGQRILELSKWEEHLKLDATMEQLKDDLSKGKKVVVAAESVAKEDKLIVKGLEGKQLTGFLTLLAERLDSEGIKYGEIQGKVSDSVREKNVEEFQNGELPLLIMTTAAGGTGINLDDTTGDNPRSLIVVTKNWSGDKVMQLIGRVSRKTTQSPSMVHVVSLEGGLADQHKSAVVNKKLKMLLSSSGEPSILDDFERTSFENIRDENGNKLIANDSGQVKTAPTVKNKPAPTSEATSEVTGDNYLSELRRHGAEPRNAETKGGKQFIQLKSIPANKDAIQASLENNPAVAEKWTKPSNLRGEWIFRIWDEAVAKQVATDLNDRGVVYSRQSVSDANRGKSGKSVEDIKSWVGKSTLERMSELGHKVVVVQSALDIPDSNALDMDQNARGLYVPAIKTSYLVADNIHSKNDARTTFAHEVVGHYGMRTMMGEEFAPVLEMVQEMKANGDPEVMAAAKIVEERNGDLSLEEEAEEIIAVLAEDLASRPLLTRVYDAIRMWVKRTFAKNYVMSNNSIRDLILDAKRHVDTKSSSLSDTAQTASQLLYSKVSKMDAPKQMEVFADMEENIHKTLGGLAKANFRSSTVDAASKVINQNKTRNFLQYWLTNSQIFRTYKAAFDWTDGNRLKTVNDLLGEFRVDKERALHGFEKEEKIWDKLSSKEANSLASLMRDSTIAGVHPDVSMANEAHEFVRTDQKTLAKLQSKEKPTLVDLADIAQLEESLKFMKEEHVRLSKEWKKLTHNAKTVYSDTRLMLSQQWEMERDELMARIDRQIENPVHRESAKKALGTRMGTLIKRGPYFPLSRFGDNVVIAWADINGKREFIREQFESRTEALRALKWHKGKWGDKNARMTFMADMTGTSQSGDLFSFRDNLFTALDENRDDTLNDANMDEEAKSAIRRSTEQLKNEINDLMLNTLPSSSIMQRRRHRHGTKGASSDMRRSVQNLMLQSAQQISKIKYADRIRSELNEIGVENRKFSVGEPSEVKQEHADIVSATHAEMSKRFELTMNPTGAAWASNAGRLAFFHYLGWSPAAAMVNLTQVPAIAIPVVGARYGMAKTSAVFLKTMTDWHLGKSKLTTRDAYKSFARDGNANITEDEKNFIKVLIDRGDIDITRVGSITEEAHSDQRTPSVFGTKMQKFMRTGAYMFHGAEMANREVTGLATFRLIKQKHPELFKGATFKNSETMTESELKVYEEVRELIGTTQFLYESENRPRAMRENNIVRTMTTFKIYGQHIIYMYAQLAREALGRDKSLSKEKRREAMRALAGLVSFQMIAAGATGVLPIAVSVWMAGLAYNLFADDEDEIVSSEADFTQWIDDMVKGAFDDDEQEFASALFSKGIGNALGVDLHSRVSQDTNLLIMMPDRPASNGKEWYKELLISAAGPVFGGVFGNTASFAQDVYEGNPAKSLKNALPKVLRDSYKAVDYGLNGVKTNSDLDVIESLDTSDLVIQALGFTPAVIASTHQRRFARLNKSQHIGGIRTDVLADIYKAISNKDAGAIKEALVRVTEWNSFITERIESIDDPLKKILSRKDLISASTIKSSLRSKINTKMTAVEGIRIPKAHMYLIDEYTFGQ